MYQVYEAEQVTAMAKELFREEKAKKRAALLKHLLVFYNVGDRSWAISQNLLVGGKTLDGSDLTSETSYALMDAYLDMNLPQPILSVKLHKNTLDGRRAREQLNYGVDPLLGDADQGMGFRMLSCMCLPFEKMGGGYASHFGVNPGLFQSPALEGKGREFADRVIRPLFFNPENPAPVAPFYLYVNVTTPETLRRVLAEPEKYAPSGVYIVRIHGTFVNFLDLSPDIQQDIIKRLDLESTRL